MACMRTMRSLSAYIEALLERAGRHGVPGLVIDQPGSIAQLVLAVAAKREVPEAYVPGLVMRRAADLYPGEAKTDRRDAFILADTARTRRKQVHWLDAASDGLLAQLRVLNGFVADAVAKAVSAQDVTVPTEAATGRVIAELADELDRIFTRRDALEEE